MHASETKIRQLIEGTKQYVIPLFQRPYSWSEKQWKTLWEDVDEQARHAAGRPHFFGSIVTSPAKSVPHGVAKWLLIDGQQRLTSVQVFLAAIRDTAKAAGNKRLSDRITEDLLLNRHEEGDELLRLLPTQDDRPAFRAIVLGSPPPPGRLTDCHEYFVTKLSKPAMADRLDAVMTALVDKLSLVGITCDDHDNPHLIFESLNAKGEKLTPADLIRNFLLMRIPVSEQERVFRAYWLPIQQALGGNLTDFVRDYLMKEGRVLQKADVYFELKDRLIAADAPDAETFMQDLHRQGLFYSSFVDPSRAKDPQTVTRLDRLKRLESTVTYPLLLRLFDATDRGELTATQRDETLDVLESFLIRRSICNVPTNQLRRMLPPVFDTAVRDAGLADFVAGIRTILGGRRCPDDSTFAAALPTQPLYANAKKNARLRVILDRLEQSYEHKEPANVSTATIEHVMPQTLTPQWEGELGPDAEQQWARLLHTLGNLTLTGYNADMSNRPFAEKKLALAQSHFELNRDFAQYDHWTLAAIEARGQEMTHRALTVWPDLARPEKPDRVAKAFEPTPVAVQFAGKHEPVGSWKQAAMTLVAAFEDHDPGLLQRVHTEKKLSGLLSTDPTRFPQARKQIGGLYVQAHGSADTMRRIVRRVARAAGLSKTDYAYVMPDAG